MRVLITIDADTCVGIGKCEEIDEDAVEMGDDGITRPTGIALDEDRARALCEGCPTGAISIAGPAEE
jgi:ferredoxin